MREGYHATDDNGCPYSELDELLCEYVDDTMDPTIRRVFEEFLYSDPELLEHVEKLRSTRELLCHYGCQLHAPHGLQVRLRHRLGCEMLRTQSPRFSMILDRLGAVAAFASAMAIIVIGGMLLGGTSDAREDVAEKTGSTATDLTVQDSEKSYAYPFEDPHPWTARKDRPPLPYSSTWPDQAGLSTVLAPSTLLITDSDRRGTSTNYSGFRRLSTEP